MSRILIANPNSEKAAFLARSYTAECSRSLACTVTNADRRASDGKTSVCWIDSECTPLIVAPQIIETPKNAPKGAERIQSASLTSVKAFLEQFRLLKWERATVAPFQNVSGDPLLPRRPFLYGEKRRRLWERRSCV